MIRIMMLTFLLATSGYAVKRFTRLRTVADTPEYAEYMSTMSRGLDGIMYTLHEWTVYFMQYTNEQWAEYCAWRSRWSTSEWLQYFNGIHVPACFWTLWYFGYPNRARRLLELI